MLTFGYVEIVILQKVFKNVIFSLQYRIYCSSLIFYNDINVEGLVFKKRFLHELL